MEIEELNEGIELCIQNAKRLLKDAQFLFDVSDMRVLPFLV